EIRPRRQVHALMNGLKPFAVDREFVLAGRQMQPLKDAVEFIDDAGEVAVGVHLGLLRGDFEPDGTSRNVRRRRWEGILARFAGHRYSGDRGDNDGGSGGYHERGKLHGFLSLSNHGTNSADCVRTLFLSEKRAD